MRMILIAFVVAGLTAAGLRAQSPQDIAQAKANEQAARGGGPYHPGGGFGGGTHEGCGMASTPERAIQTACYYGQLPVIASAVAQSANGMWYSTNIYSAGGQAAATQTATVQASPGVQSAVSCNTGCQQQTSRRGLFGRRR